MACGLTSHRTGRKDYTLEWTYIHRALLSSVCIEFESSEVDEEWFGETDHSFIVYSNGVPAVGLV